jgi:hypothetical protein
LAHDSSSLSYAVRGSFLLKYFGLFCLVAAGLGSALVRLRVSTHMQFNEAMVLAAILLLFIIRSAPRPLSACDDERI